jgi:hypothetical protein
MKLSLQKFLLVLLFKSLFISSTTTKLRSTTISLDNLKENNSPQTDDKSELENDKEDKLSLLEKKSETKSTPVKLK